MAKNFYSVAEAAERLGKPEDEVKALAANGDLQVFRDRNQVMLGGAGTDPAQLQYAVGEQVFYWRAASLKKSAWAARWWDGSIAATRVRHGTSTNAPPRRGSRPRRRISLRDTVLFDLFFISGGSLSGSVLTGPRFPLLQVSSFVSGWML